jgi:hypothetical protein
MKPSSVRLASILLTVASGTALSQVDSVATRIDTAALAVPPPATADTAAPAMAAPAMVAHPADTISTHPIAIEKPASEPAPATSIVDSAKPHRSWSFEATTLYGWRMGQLLHEEDRLTRDFKVVLIGKNNDTSNVRPVASGTMVQAAAWWKATVDQQVGLGFGYGRFYEHPVTSYSSDLSETFFDQYLLTGRYRISHGILQRLRVFGEAALGWNHAQIERIPVVAAHRQDSLIKFKQAQLDQIAALNLQQTVEGVHGQAGLGIQWEFPKSWSVSLSGAATWDRIWFKQATSVNIAGSSSDLVETLSRSPAFWGLDVGLSVARDF